MALSFLSFVSLYGIYLRRCFATSGLTSQSIDIDKETTIHLWAPKPDQTVKEQKPALLLLHGFGPSVIWQWCRQVQFFTLYFRIYVPDLVFFGNSKMKSKESYGGFVAYHMAKLCPDKVEKVVIASSGVNMRKADNMDLLKRANKKTIEEIMLPKTATQLRTLTRLAVTKRVNIIPDFLLNDFVNQLYLENRKEKMELLRGVTLVGGDDTVTLAPLQQEYEHCTLYLDSLPLLGKKTRLEVIENTSHVPQIENSAQFNSIVKIFLCAS
ncbi:hypothetical protein CRYUN_Cryun33cG0079000 [Craigia yunnanensis]